MGLSTLTSAGFFRQRQAKFELNISKSLRVGFVRVNPASNHFFWFEQV